MADNARARRFRFNFIDLALLLAAAAAVGVLIYIFASPSVSVSGTAAPDTVELEYTVEASELRLEWQGLTKIGDSIVDTTTLYTLGEVVGVTYSPERYIGYNEAADTVVEGEYPDRLTVRVTIRATAQSTTDGYIVGGGFHIAVGVPVNFRSPSLTSEGYVVSVSEVSGNE